MSPDYEYIRRDAWLAEVLDREVYRVAIPEAATVDTLDVICRRIQELRVGRVFMYAKINTTDMGGVERLEAAGFHLIDTNVVFDKPCRRIGLESEQSSVVGRYVVRSAVPGDREQAVELARRSFTCSRFHLDPAIPRCLADEIKSRWVDNFFAGARGDSLVVALSGKTIAGFCLLLHGSDGTATIDLIAVDAAHRGRGVAGEMISFVESLSNGFAEILVGTQIANTASIRCYERLGFRLRSAQYVLHYHHPPKGER